MSESTAREAAASEPATWLEIRKGALEWICIGRPEWRNKYRQRPGEPKISRIIADTGVPQGLLYRVQKQQGVPGPVSLDANSVAQLVAVGTFAQEVSDDEAFDRLFKVVRSARPVEAKA